jgi:hypothetical protein
MGLDNFGSNDKEENSGSTKREYVRITDGEFVEFLNESGYIWHRMYPNDGSNINELQKFSGEEVFEIPLDHIDENLSIRIFSTISKSTGKARDKGDDAIRCVIWGRDLDRPIGGRKKTLRIKTWRKNLEQKLESLYSEWDDHVTNCDECGNWLVKRDGQYGEFLGCVNYPECDNTRQIE